MRGPDQWFLDTVNIPIPIPLHWSVFLFLCTVGGETHYPVIELIKDFKKN
jgi:hypothetical protein